MSARNIGGASAGSAILALLCLGLGMAGPAGAQDDLKATTGIDSPQAQQLDKDADKAAADHALALAELKEAGRKRQPITDALARTERLNALAHAKAREAADLRADAAFEQRCVKPSAGADAGAADAQASPHLCAAVLAGRKDANANDPWTLCACARRYLIGAVKEIEMFRAGAKRYIGRAVGSYGDSTLILTEAELGVRLGIDKDKPVPSLQYLDEFFRALMREVQRQFASDRIRRLISVTPPNLQPEADRLNAYRLSTARAVASIEVAKAIEMLWGHYLAELSLQRDLLAYEMERIAQPYVEAARAAQQAELEKFDRDEGAALAIAHAFDAQQLAWAQDIANALRAMVAPVKEVRLRLLRDAQAWQVYATQNGDLGNMRREGNNDFTELVAYWFKNRNELLYTIGAWRGQIAKTDYPWLDLIPGQAPDANYDNIENGFRKRLPEVKIDRDQSFGRVMLVYPLNVQDKETIGTVASGAGRGAGP